MNSEFIGRTLLRMQRGSKRPMSSNRRTYCIHVEICEQMFKLPKNKFQFSNLNVKRTDSVR